MHFESQCYTSELTPLIQAIGKKISLVSVQASFCSIWPVPSNKAFGHDEKWLPRVGEASSSGSRLQACSVLLLIHKPAASASKESSLRFTQSWGGPLVAPWVSDSAFLGGETLGFFESLSHGSYTLCDWCY